MILYFNALSRLARLMLIKGKENLNKVKLKFRAMKTKSIIFSIILLASISFASNAQAGSGDKLRFVSKSGIIYEIRTLVENYINDIPFDTKQVVKELQMKEKPGSSMIQFCDIKQLRVEEQDVDDIPFNTSLVVKAIKEEKMAKK